MTSSEHQEIISMIRLLASQDKYMLRLHARQRMNERGLTDEDIKDVLINVQRVIRIDEDKGISKAFEPFTKIANKLMSDVSSEK